MMIPKNGFNVCIFDDFGRPGQMLTKIAHVKTRQKAENIAKRHKEETVYIYGKK